MAVASAAELREALGSNDFQRIVGTPEEDWLDFKRSPYQLDTDKDRWELAKDVAALANQRGGFLVIGVDTSRRPFEIVDTASEIRCVAKTQVDPTRYRAVILAWVYPPLRGVTAHWFPPDPDKDEGLFVLEIPDQDPRSQPFMVRKMITEDDKVRDAFGIPVRDGATVLWLPVGEVHRLISDGLRSRRVAGELPPTAEPEARPLPDNVMDEIEHSQGWETEPVYFLQASAPQGTTLDDLHEESGVRGSLQRIEPLRAGGFNLGRPSQLEVRNGTLASFSDPRKAIWIDSSGLCVVGAEATHDFLAWATESMTALIPGAVLLNPVAVVEFTLEFFRFVHRELVPRSSPGSWRFTVICRRFVSGGPVALGQGPGVQILLPGGVRNASSDNWRQSLQGTGTAGRDAYQALALLYQLFGQPPSAIPFTENDAVSEQVIQEFGRA
jgi:hypothetical protein